MGNKILDNIKGNWTRNMQDPFANAKFNYKVTRLFVFFIMGIIAFIFIKMIYNQFKDGTTYGLLIAGAMIIIMVYLLYNIYSKVLLPQQKILNHYQNMPTAIETRTINVKEQIDDILGQFDEKGRRKVDESKKKIN